MELLVTFVLASLIVGLFDPAASPQDAPRNGGFSLRLVSSPGWNSTIHVDGDGFLHLNQPLCAPRGLTYSVGNGPRPPHLRPRAGHGQQPDVDAVCAVQPSVRADASALAVVPLRPARGPLAAAAEPSASVQAHEEHLGPRTWRQAEFSPYYVDVVGVSHERRLAAPADGDAAHGR